MSIDEARTEVAADENGASWKCSNCGEKFVTHQDEPGINSCACGEAWVDHGTHSIRFTPDAHRLDL